ncbi:MAG: hypothetical protein WAK16_02835 [Candidatus Cybelea sp.]|jgi:hypothetical protein
MADAKSEASAALRAHGQAIDELHRKLAAIPGVDTVKLKVAVEKLKTAHASFEEDAAEFVVH